MRPSETIRVASYSLHRRRAVGGQHFPGEIERTGNQDARRLGKPERSDPSQAPLRSSPQLPRQCRHRARSARPHPPAMSCPDGSARQSVYAPALRNFAGTPRCPWSPACRRSSPAGAARAPQDRPSAAAALRPPSALCPPSSQSSLPGGASGSRRPVVRRCMRAGQSACTTPSSKARAGRSSLAARNAAIAVPALSN